MTDKELRKLSRLELLELLLEQSKENEKLREALANSPSVVPAFAPKGGDISPEAFVGMEPIVKKLDYVINLLNHRPSFDAVRYTGVNPTSNNDHVYPAKYSTPPVVYPARQSDEWLFQSIISFFAKNEELLMYLPEEISREIKMRIRGVF